MKSKLIATMLTTSILVSSFGYAFAATKSELNSQSNDLDSKIAEKKEEIEEVENNISAAMKEVQSLVAQISQYEQEISDLSKKIDTVSNEIAHPAHARQVRPCMERVGWVFGNGLHRNAAGHSGVKGIDGGSLDRPTAAKSRS